MQRFQAGLVFKAHRLLYHSTLGLSVIKKRRSDQFVERLDHDLGGRFLLPLPNCIANFVARFGKNSFPQVRSQQLR